MRVLKLTNIYPSRTDPVSGIFIRDEVELLRPDFDIHVAVATLRSLPFTRKEKSARLPLIDTEIAERFSYISAPRWRFSGLAGFSMSRGLKRQLEIHNPDILHIHSGFPCALTLLHLNIQIPVVVTIHGSDWYKAIRIPATRKRLVAALEKADRILTVGKKLKADITRLAPHLEHRIEIMHHSINPDAFPISKNRPDEKRNLGLNAELPLVFTAANLTPEKGLDVLLKAVAESTILQNTAVVIAGRPFSSSYEKELASLIDRHNLKNIQFTGLIDRARLTQYYRAADVYVQPSRSEGFGIAILEAACTGCPVVATRCGGPEETVTTEMGLLVEPDNPVELARAIERQIKKKMNPETIRSEVVSRFGPVKIKKDLIRVYRTAAGESAKVEG